MSEKTTKLAFKNTRAENEKEIVRALRKNDEVMKLQESVRAKTGIDMFDEKEFPVTERRFSWKKLEQKLIEADSASAFPQVLRAGVQTIADAAYQSTATTFEDWTHTVQSTKDTELYAPLQGIAFPRQVGPQEIYPEVGAAGLDIKLKNYKYGSIFPLEKELLEDDQTGQFAKQAGLLGEYMKIVLEVWVMGKLASVSGMKYADLSVPISETKPSTEATYPWSTSLVGGGANRPGSYGALNQANIQSGIIGLMNQKNILGLKMLVRPSRILIGPTYSFDLSVLLNSSYYPSGAAATGNVGGAFAINTLKGIADSTVSRFMFKNDGTVNGDSKAWYLLDDSVPWFVVQIREPVLVEQENPASGQSFDRDVVRTKARMRANADFIDPRFAWQGNDGSV
jgi:hypothetical protein